MLISYRTFLLPGLDDLHTPLYPGGRISDSGSLLKTENVPKNNGWLCPNWVIIPDPCYNNEMFGLCCRHRSSVNFTNSTRHSLKTPILH